MFSSNTSQVSADFNYVEDVFSTYLYKGNNGAQTITNGIDLAGKGGLVWIKGRLGQDHSLWDTLRGTSSELRSNSSIFEQTVTNGLTSFGSSGFGLNGANGSTNDSTVNYASWTFRKQPKFFDVVTWVGDGTSSRYINHSLNDKPNFIFSKCISSSGSWIADSFAWSNNFGGGNPNTAGALNSTAAFSYTGSVATWCWGSSSTQFYVGSAANVSGQTYVAYLFAHNAGGFGATGTDNVISCGSYTTDGSGNATVDLGYEPQWLLTKWTNAADNWHLFDDMRGFSINKDGTSGNTNDLYPNSSSAEVNRSADELYKTSVGFNVRGSGSSRTFIYIAIRRGPMKTPTLGTSVFSPEIRTGNNTQTSVTGIQFPPDLVMVNERTANSGYRPWFDRLRGSPRFLSPNGTGAEVENDTDVFKTFNQNGVTYGNDVANNGTNKSGINYVDWFFRRAPGFFDEVCTNGNSIGDLSFTHNLGVAPELVIIKSRVGTFNWYIYSSKVASPLTTYGTLTASAFLNSGVTYYVVSSTTFQTFTGGWTANNGATVAYLFATCAGVSKVGSYTGNGSSQTIACGFAAGARFVMIKRTDSTGDWYIWDTARGIIAGNDPYIKINEFYTPEVTTNDTIDPDSSGFIVNQVAATNVNVSSATYIFLAIA